MAARTSTGIGVGITVTLLAVVSLALFVTTVVFYSQRQAAQTKLTELQATADDFVREAERSRDDVQQLRSAAQRQRQSVVGYLSAQRRDILGAVTGNPSTSYDDFQKQLAGFKNSESDPNPILMNLIRDTRLELGAEKKARQDADAAFARAQQDRANEVARVKAIEDAHKATLESLNKQLDTYKGEIDAAMAEVQTAKNEAQAFADKTRAEAEDRIAALNAQIAEKEREVLLARDTISRLQGELKGRTFKSTEEFALVDGQIIGLEAASNSVYINLGRRQKVRIGMTFEVYSDAAAIRADERTGDYPAGKATIEVTNIDENSSTCRIVQEKKGNPVVRGDVVANAVFDPNKVYTLLIYGNFDANGDGIATAQEHLDIRALVEGWGGKVADELTGSVDFLVLGQKPTLPPEPPPGAPVAVIDEYLRLKQISDKYDELFRRASETSIPVLNENRLYTLIGKRYGL
jgi:hypothetical protein